MPTHIYKSFIRPGPSSSISPLSIVQSTITSSKNHQVKPQKWSRLHSSPARLGFPNIGRPPFTYGTLSKTSRAPEFVGFNFCILRHLSDDTTVQKHAKDLELSRQNRYGDIKIKGNENDMFGIIPRWVRWLFGSIIALWAGYKSSDLFKIEGDLEKVVEIVENVAETAEKVATMTEEISEDIEEEFPQDGAINKAAHFVEHLSEEVAEKAHRTEEFIHKVTSTEKIVETNIEAAVEALEGLIFPKPVISDSNTNRDDQVTDIHTEKTNSKSKLE